MRVLVLILLVGLAACSGHDLATPSGEVFAFNPTLWTPMPADMVEPPRVTP